MNWFGSMVWYILNVFVQLFIHYIGFFWASEHTILSRETVRSDGRKSLYRSMEKAFLQSCFLIIVMHVMLSGWLSGLYRIVGILVYMRACGCLVAYNVLSWGWLCIIMQSVDGFLYPESGIRLQPDGMLPSWISAFFIPRIWVFASGKKTEYDCGNGVEDR